MTLYEVLRNSIDPLMPPLHRRVKKMLIRAASNGSRDKEILDVGGRKSTYTISVPGNVTVIDLPRTTAIQDKLNLGVDQSILEELQKRRSNIREYLIGDMTASGLPSTSFDICVSVEVLEHVEEDDLFVSEVARVLKPGGIFIMTTPNGDYLENNNPDHKRHYKKAQLEELLSRHFEYARVDYAIAGGYFRKLGLRSWSAKRPIRTAMSILGNLVNSIQSAGTALNEKRTGTHHLISVARRSKDLNY